MKVIFAGPSLPDAADHAGAVHVRGPAALGDVAKAVLQGATVIGIVDGFFESVASVWHKEILFALSQGVQVFGAASMGALRAAECAPYGMIGVGEVFAAYASGRLVDDDAVGQVHGPAELDYVALSDPLVNIEATLDRLSEQRLVTPGEEAALRAAARELFFKERTFAHVTAAAPLSDMRKVEVMALFARHRRELKREDALALVARVTAAADARVTPPGGWRFEETQIWERLRAQWQNEVNAGKPTVAAA
jgi:hypothetical protein